MIHVLEFPHQAQPRSWFAFDADDFIRKVCSAVHLPDWEIHDVVTPRELLNRAGAAEDLVAARADFPALSALAEEHGFDTVLYRADCLLGPGVYRSEPVAARAAWRAALLTQLADCKIYWSDEQAMAALDDQAGFPGTDGAWAREALRDQLVSLEVLEGI
jgi:hypothetical protein